MAVAPMIASIAMAGVRCASAEPPPPAMKPALKASLIAVAVLLPIAVRLNDDACVTAPSKLAFVPAATCASGSVIPKAPRPTVTASLSAVAVLWLVAVRLTAPSTWMLAVLADRTSVSALARICASTPSPLIPSRPMLTTWVVPSARLPFSALTVTAAPCWTTPSRWARTGAST